MSNEDLIRLHRRVVRHVYRLFAGGTSFGVDLPTLRACRPLWYRVYVGLFEEVARRTNKEARQIELASCQQRTEREGSAAREGQGGE